jgi:glycosyltransferase involved in cell wall biosynthesis
MKMAIVADWLDKYSGAERCIESFTNLYSDADIFAMVDFLNSTDREIILKNKRANTTFLQNFKNFRNLLPLFPYAIESIDLRDYEVILSSSHSVAKNVLTNSEQLHICYCYTPMRYIWDMYFDYLEELSPIKQKIFAIIAKRLREWDFASSNRADYFIAISNYVKKRIEKIYNKKATVIYPPVDVEKFEFSEKKEDFYITISRIVPYKKVDLIVKAFNKNGKKLVVIGGGEVDKLKKIANKNIEILGYQNENIVKDYLKRAKAFVYAAKEDFGISPVEALACGTPVIAYKKGGVVESVGEFGIYFDNQSEDALNRAIKEFEKKEIDYKKLRERAMKFNRARFEKEISQFIKSKYEVFN